MGGAPGSDFNGAWKLNLPPYQNCGRQRRLEPGSQQGLTFSSPPLQQYTGPHGDDGKEGATWESGSLGLVVLRSRKISRGEFLGA